jgi:hypothetical protein
MVDFADLRKSETAMRDLLAEVAHELLRVDAVEHGEGMVTLPAVYPGGAPVVVHIRREGDTFVVSDRGNGYLAAELLGGLRTYVSLAPAIAAHYGVRYDGDMMFATEVSRPWLTNAIIFTGSASRKAVERTAEKVAEDRDVSYREMLRERIREAFPASQSSFDVSLVGSSTRNWRFAAQVVLASDRRAVFDIVTPHPNSVAAAFIKFEDISMLESGVEGVAVASRPLDPADKVLISRVAPKLIHLNDDAETFRKAA